MPRCRQTVVKLDAVVKLPSNATVLIGGCLRRTLQRPKQKQKQKKTGVLEVDRDQAIRSLSLKVQV